MPSTVFRLFSDINAKHNHELLAKKMQKFFAQETFKCVFLVIMRKAE